MGPIFKNFVLRQLRHFQVMVLVFSSNGPRGLGGRQILGPGLERMIQIPSLNPFMPGGL